MPDGFELIVVGVDKSATARAAADVAARLARMGGARLHVVTALNSIRAETITGPGGEEFFVDQSDEARLHLNDLGAVWPDLEVSVAVATGKPGDALVAEATRLGADLIVVGNKRVQSLARVLGSVASDVLRHAPCDVYIADTTSTNTTAAS